ncbi:MAG: AMP-binding protein [Candidatus Tectomicrobia bacterium]|nr:AMP-binding protein [Candidatus Tectomicrobia bacterium]
MTLPREQLDELHWRRIKLLLAYAYRNSPLYRRLYDKAGITPEDVHTWEDFYTKVPFTDKPDFLKEQETSLFPSMALPEDYHLYYFQTSGTTGAPLREAFTHYDSLRCGDEWAIMFWDCGIRPSDRFYFCFNWGLWIGLWSAYWGVRAIGATVYSGGGMTSEQRIQQILDLQPTVVVGTPTYLVHLLDLARKQGIDLSRSSVKFVSGGGEAGFNIPTTRRYLEQGWGATVCDFYGIGEVNLGFIECRAHAGGVHAVESAYHSFSADPATGERVPDGEVGENIVSTFAHTGQVFIKYRTHDLVRRSARHEHGCGWTWSWLDGSVLGRSDFMVTIRGVNIYPTAIENLLAKVPGASPHYELHISRAEGMDRMLVKIEVDPSVPATDYATVAAQAEAVYRDAIGVRLETEVVPPQTLPRYELKSKRIFDHRPKEERLELYR